MVECSFGMQLTKRKEWSVGTLTTFSFRIGLHIRDLDLLRQIQAHFNNVGNVRVRGEVCTFEVTALNDILTTIIPHFDKYPMITQKQAFYLL
jgi:hypothetical protein